MFQIIYTRIFQHNVPKNYSDNVFVDICSLLSSFALFMSQHRLVSEKLKCFKELQNIFVPVSQFYLYFVISRLLTQVERDIQSS